MYKVIAVVFISVFCLSAKAQNAVQWPPIKQSDAQNLALRQGDTWKKLYNNNKILMGLGPNGADKLQQLINSSDPNSKALLAQVMNAADRIIKETVPVYKDPSQFVNNGQTALTASNELWMRPVSDKVVLLAVALRVTNNNAYRQHLHDLVMALCQFPSWGTGPANADLVAGHASRAIAMAWNWIPDLFMGAERQLVLNTVRTRVNVLCSAIYGKAGGYWASAYLTNHNPVSVAGAGMSGLAFINDIPEAKEWLAASWLDFQQVAQHSYSDGSSPEGTAYWAYGLSFTLQFIEAVNGALPSYDLYNSAFLKEAANYRINNSTPGFTHAICWGDSYRDDFSGPQHFLLRLASQYNIGEAAYVAYHQVNGCGGGDDTKAWAWLWSQPAVAQKAPTQLDYHAPVYDLVNSRSGWGDDDYVFSLKSGFNNRSHAHLDAGSFALLVGSDWLIPMPFYGKGGSSKDFWDQSKGRWSYFSNATESNSTFIINRGIQRFDLAARGTIDRFESYDDAMITECDLSQAWADVNAARRKIFHKRGEYIIVQDNIDLKSPGQVEWLLQVPPNGVVNSNSVNIQGRNGSATVTLLAPATDLTVRESVSEKKDAQAIGNTLGASVSGKTAAFTAVIEPKIRSREYIERAYSVADDGTIEIRSPGAEERLKFSDNAAAMKDQKTKTSATARLMYVKTTQDHVSEIIVSDAQNLSAGNIQLSSESPFSADLIKADGQSWKLNISAGKNISVKGINTISAASGAISGKQLPCAGSYRLE